MGAQYPKTLNREEATDFLLRHKCRDGLGLLDYNEAKQIAAAVEPGQVWELKNVPTQHLTHHKFPARYNRRCRLPGFALDLGNNQYEVLDGRHRAAEANAAGEATVPMYIATPHDNQAPESWKPALPVAN